MGLSAKLSTNPGPTIGPGQRLRRSVAASPGPKNTRVKVAPVRKRRKRLAKKIARRFGVLHFRDVERDPRFEFVVHHRIGGVTHEPPRLRLGIDTAGELVVRDVRVSVTGGD